ncbi:MAG: GNAT family N-acetyltransferase [Eubacteriales bacterium]|nr:GNAT family N-acetyltransferase [Eubacteriales bacterium]
MSERIRPARREDIPQVLALYARVVTWMLQNGYRQWNTDYPNRAFLERDVDAGTAFVAEAEGAIQGSFTADGNISPEYAAVAWQFAGRPYSIHRLCVDPQAKGKGIATRMVAYAENTARAQGAQVIRLDTCADNSRAQSLYLRAGYVVRGTCKLPRRPELDFVCMEKQL